MTLDQHSLSEPVLSYRLASAMRAVFTRMDVLKVCQLLPILTRLLCENDWTSSRSQSTYTVLTLMASNGPLLASTDSKEFKSAGSMIAAASFLRIARGFMAL